MYQSMITAKGQTTIPKEIRDYLHLDVEDKIVYVPEGDRVYMLGVSGDLRETQAVFKKYSKGVIPFKKVREYTKKLQAKEVMKTK